MNEKTLRMFVYAMLAAALFTPLIVGSGFVFPFVLPKALWFQFTIELAFLGYLLLLVKGWAKLPKINVIGIAVILFFLSAALSTVFGVDPARSFWSKAERMDGLFFLSHLVLFFFLLLAVIRHEEEWLRMLRFLLVVGVLLAAVTLIAPYFVDLIRGSGQRWGGTFGNPSFLATYFLGLTFLSLTFFLREKRSGGKMYFGALGAIFFSLVILSSTRGAWLGFAAAYPLFLLLLVLGDFKRWVKFSAAVLITFAVIATLVFLFRDAIGSRYPALRDFRELTLHSATAQTRFIVWRVGINAFMAHPLLGWGPENYIVAYNKYYDSKIQMYESAIFDRAHNRIIDILVMQGIIGLITYLFLFAAIFWGLIRVLRKRLVGAVWPAGFAAIFSAHFVQNLVLFEMPTSYVMFFFFAAFASWVISAAGEKSQAVVSKLPHQILWGGKLAALLLFLVTLGAFWFGTAEPMFAGGGIRKVITLAASLPNVPPQNADEEIRRAAEAYRGIRNRDTFLNNEIDKLMSSYVSSVANSSETLRNEPEFKEFVDTAFSRLKADVEAHPLDYDMILEAASFTALNIEGYENAARPGSQTMALLERAVEASPRREDVYQQLVFFNLVRKDAAAAKEIIERQVERYPENGRLWFIKANVDIVVGDFENADMALELAERYGVAIVRNRLIYIARLFEEAGDFRRATVWYERYLGELKRSYAEGGTIDWGTWSQTGIPLMELYVKTGERQKAAELAEFLEKFVPANEMKSFREYLMKLKVK